MIRQSSLLAAVSFIVLAGGASAQTFDVRSVHSGDPAMVTRQTALQVTRNVTTPSGARGVLNQIRAASTAVCGGQPEASASEDEKSDFVQCFSGAVRDGVSQAHNLFITAALADDRDTLLASR